MTSVTAALGVLLVVAIPTAAVGATALGIGLVRDRRDRRRAERTPELRGALLDRLADDDPEWETWVAELTECDRQLVATLVEHYCQVLTGDDRRQLRALGRALGLEDRARGQLVDGDVAERCRALRWFVLLGTPVSPDLLLATCTDDARTRSGAARLLWATDHPQAAEFGTALCYWSPAVGPSAIDADTLFRLNRADPSPLVRRVAAGGDAWSPAVLVVALRVFERCHGVDGRWQFQWVHDALAHDDASVRAAAVAVLDRHGWREPALTDVDVDALLDDPDPDVRRAAYRLVAHWGARRTLTRAVDGVADASARDRLELARALVDAQRVPETVPAPLADAVAWARAEARARGVPA